jgi:NADH:ubiquinone oxidoreductase subunit 5 (subunit L)/multisubunit Na+/H+ antiporter MnhA subunit
MYFVFFLRRPNISKGKLKYLHDGPFFIVLPLILLCFSSIFFGFLFKDLFIGPGTDV